MITFLPYKDFHRCAECLDNQRLNSQRSEALWMVRRLKAGDTHTVSIMWLDHIEALIQYGMTMCKEWSRRGFRDNLWPDYYLESSNPKVITYPQWLGSFKLHSSHRGSLIRKDFAFYSKYKWKDDFTQKFFWFDNKYDWRTNLHDREDLCN